MEGVFSKNTVVVLVVLVLYHWAHTGASATTCSDVTTSIQPCMSTLNGTSNTATSDCCNGLLNVANMPPPSGALSTCQCILSMVNMPGPGMSIQVDVFTSIQNQCNVSLGFNLSTSC